MKAICTGWFRWVITGVVLLAMLIGGYFFLNSNHGTQELAPTEHVMQKIKKAEEEPTPYYIVFTKKDCPFCAAGAKDVKAAMDAMEKKKQWNSYVVDIDSEFGKELKEKYQVKHASTILRMSNNIAFDQKEYAKSEELKDQGFLDSLFENRNYPYHTTVEGKKVRCVPDKENINEIYELNEKK